VVFERDNHLNIEISRHINQTLMIFHGNLMRHVFSYEITQHPNETLNDISRQTIKQ
jgi:hypothetical protein